ncbi:hypothetical protein Ancab_023220 [Ancistrocladus abbreviatus]
MGVAVLYAEEFLKSRLSHNQHLISPPTKPRRSSANRSSRRRRSPTSSPPPPPPPPPSPPNSVADRTKGPVVGQVRILKRGETMTPKTPTTLFDDGRSKSEDSVDDPILRSISRLGSKPESVPKGEKLGVTCPIFDGFYAGSAFFTSPPPSSLPIPVMITKSNCGFTADEAANDLRRILRLD